MPPTAATPAWRLLQREGRGPGRLDGSRPGRRARFSGRRAGHRGADGALFGEGRHPNADARSSARSALPERATQQIDAASRARLRRIASTSSDTDVPPSLRRARSATTTSTTGCARDTAGPGRGAGPDPHRARAAEMFAEEHGRTPVDARELSGSSPALPASDHRGGRVRPDVLPGQERVARCGRSPPRRSPSRSSAAHHAAVADALAGWRSTPPTPGAARNGVAAGRRHRAGRGGVHPPRLPRRRPGPAHPRRGHRTRSQTLTTGGGWRWTGGSLFKANVAASERYNTRLEALLIDRLGRRLRRRGQAPTAGKRPVREIVGVDRPAAPALVHAAGPAIERPPRRAGRRVPGRARPPADRDRGRQAGPAGHPGDPRRQARTPLRGRAARRLAGRGRRASWAATRPRASSSRP